MSWTRRAELAVSAIPASNMETKQGFRGDFYFLSNMYETDCVYKGVVFPSSEHLYQWLKTEPGWWRDKILEAPHGKVAKKLAANTKCPKREIPGGYDWDSWRIHLMKRAVWSKFQNKELEEKLVDTGNICLVEHNQWGDTFWGVSKGVGKNNLGKILMNLRKYFVKHRT